MVRPPEGDKPSPVMKLASGEAKNATLSPTSCPLHSDLIPRGVLDNQFCKSSVQWILTDKLRCRKNQREENDDMDSCVYLYNINEEIKIRLQFLVKIEFCVGINSYRWLQCHQLKYRSPNWFHFYCFLHYSGIFLQVKFWLAGCKTHLILIIVNKIVQTLYLAHMCSTDCGNEGLSYYSKLG